MSTTFSLQHPVSPEDDLVAVVSNLLVRMKIRVTKSSVRTSLERHPHFPSIASVRDALDGWGIRAEGLRVNPSLLPSLPLPCLAMLRDGRFVTITDVQGDRVAFVQSGEAAVHQSMQELATFWDGSILAVEPGSDAGEPQFHLKRKDERLRILARGLIWAAGGLSVLGAGLLTSILAPNPWTLAAWWLIHALGLGFSGILVSHYLTRGESLLRRVCPAKNGKGCTEVLDSPAAKLFGRIPLADLGLVYFAAGMSALLLGTLAGLSREVSGALAFMALGISPMIVFSFYYQGVVLKRWCRPCVAVQSILLANIVIAILGWNPMTSLTGLNTGLSTGLVAWSFLGIAGSWAFFRISRAPSAELDRWENRYRRLVRDPAVIGALLSRSAPLPAGPLDGDIVLGNADAPIELLILTHPECRHCGPAHQHIEQLLDRYASLLRARIRFMCPPDSSPGGILARQCVGLQLEGRSAEAIDLLRAGFTHGARQGLQAQASLAEGSAVRADAALQNALRWCFEQSLSGTPTLLLNGRALPPQVKLDDLDLFLQSNLVASNPSSQSENHA